MGKPTGPLEHLSADTETVGRRTLPTMGYLDAVDVPWPFLLIWAAGAIGLGSLFLFRPEIAEQMYTDRIARSRTMTRLRGRLISRSATIVVYRFGGAVCIAMGVVLPLLFAFGVLPPKD